MTLAETVEAPAAGSGRLHRQVRRTRLRAVVILAVAAVLTLASIIVSVSVGPANITVGEALRTVGDAILGIDPESGRPVMLHAVIVDLRMPRTLLAALVGMALAVAGAAMQAVLRNPLVSPFTLGLSSAASFGAALAIGLGVSIGALGGRMTLLLFAFAFGMLTVLGIYGIASIRGSGRETYLLTGVAIGYLFSAGVSGMKYFSADDKLKEIVLWTMGGLWGASWDAVVTLLPIAALCFVLLYLNAGDLNVMSAGEDVAASLGVRVRRLRLTTLFIATLLAASFIAFTGVIGFVGLVAPHIARMVLGGDARVLLPGSALFGALLIVVSDTVGRMVIAPVEIPVGIITSVIGVPFFVYLIVRQRRRLWG